MSDKDSHSLQSILDAISKIIQFTQPFSDPDRFFHDVKTFDAVMMNFIVIGEMVDRTSKIFKDANPQIEWNRIKGFRNLAAHNYFGIDAEEVWQIIFNDLPILKVEIEKIMLG
jgi:uncharacterized protein with HEPN domain